MTAYDARGSVEIAAHPGIVQGLIQTAVLLVPCRGSPVQGTTGRRLSPVELSLEHLLEQFVIPIPLLVIIQGHDEQIRSLEFSNNGIGSLAFEERIAKLPAKPVGHGGFYQEPAEVLGLTG